MAKVIFIGSDRNVFKDGSAVRTRMVEYSKLFEELHIVIFTMVNKSFSASDLQLGENVFIHPTYSWSRWFYPFTGAKLAKKIIGNRNNGDWVISAQDPFESGLAALWAAKKTGAKLHIQIHTDFLSPFFKSQSLLNILRTKISERVLPEADGIRVVSRRIYDALSKNKKYELKNNPVVLPIFVEKDERAAVTPYDFKKEHPDWTFVILSIGRLEPEKNFELAIESLKIICRKYPHTGLAVVGNGRSKNSLKKLADSLGMKRNIVFIESWQKDLRPFYLGADVYLQTSNFEGFGLATIEAAYAGLPIVTTDVGAAGWIFRNGENARVCPVGEANCLSFEIIKLIEDNQSREQIIGSLKNNFGKELIQNKDEYLARYKESIEVCFDRVK